MVVGSWGANEQCAAPSVGEHRANHHWPGVRIHAGKFVEDNNDASLFTAKYPRLTPPQILVEVQLLHRRHHPIFSKLVFTLITRIPSIEASIAFHLACMYCASSL